MHGGVVRKFGRAESGNENFRAGVVFGLTVGVVPDFGIVAVKTDIYAVVAEERVGRERNILALVGNGFALARSDEFLPLLVVEFAVDVHIRVGRDVVAVEEVVLGVARERDGFGYADPTAGRNVTGAF